MVPLISIVGGRLLGGTGFALIVELGRFNVERPALSRIKPFERGEVPGLAKVGSRLRRTTDRPDLSGSPGIFQRLKVLVVAAELPSPGSTDRFQGIVAGDGPFRVGGSKLFPCHRLLDRKLYPCSTQLLKLKAGTHNPPSGGKLAHLSL